MAGAVRVAGSSIIITAILIMQGVYMGYASDYYRRPPRPIISVPYTAQSDQHPQQVHVSLAGSNEMRVTWITKDEHVPSIVEYGTSSGIYVSSAQGEQTSYAYLLYRSGKIHHVVIGPLEANTIYYYRCGGYGPEHNFKTPPAQFPVTFAVVGDLGQTEWTKSTLEHIRQIDYDVLLLPGDLAYAYTYQPMWDSFGRLVEPLASSRPWMVTAGNHEIEWIPILITKPFKSFNARWRMPFEQSGSTSNLYYSFEVAGVHIVMLCSYTDYTVGSDQYNWLQADFSKVDRIRTPWLIVLLHAPWYNSNAAHQGEGHKMMEAMEPLLYAANVDMVFSGHVHAYERFTRVYMKRADPCGPVHITIGDGGNREGLAFKFLDPQPGISVFREASFGHGELRVYNATHAHWGWNRNDDDDSVLSDEVWINSLGTSGTSSCQCKLQGQQHVQLQTLPQGYYSLHHGQYCSILEGNYRSPCSNCNSIVMGMSEFCLPKA